MGEAFVLCTARYADGYPARFHVVEPWLVDVEMGGDGRREYRIGEVDPGPDLLHIRYKSTTVDAPRGRPAGRRPVPDGRRRPVCSATRPQVVESGGVPYYADQAPAGADRTPRRRPAGPVVRRPG